MKSKFEERDKTQNLRRQGLSFREIREIVPVSKSSLSAWLRYLPLSTEEERQLEDRAKRNIDGGRERAAVSNRKKRIAREDVAKKEASVIFEKFKNDPFFVLGISLYWAEGAKRTSTFCFVNSDVSMVRFMIFWLDKYLNIPKNKVFLRLHSHEDFKTENYELFWSDSLQIPMSQFRKTSYKPNKHGVFKKNPNYKGCMRLDVGGGMPMLRKVLFLVEALENHLKVLYS
jgi:DNA-binding transcriptional MerR regulator